MSNNQCAANISRRSFIRSGVLVTASVASYTFRNFSRTQLIGFMKQLNVSALNAKDSKDHLPIDPQQEAAALSDYAQALESSEPATQLLKPCRGSKSL